MSDENDDYSYHSYAFFSGLIDRYADFFEPKTKMRYFQSNFTQFEQEFMKISELNAAHFTETYSLINERAQIVSDAMRMTHIIGSELLFGLQYEAYEQNISVVYG